MIHGPQEGSNSLSRWSSAGGDPETISLWKDEYNRFDRQARGPRSRAAAPGIGLPQRGAVPSNLCGKDALTVEGCEVRGKQAIAVVPTTARLEARTTVKMSELRFGTPRKVVGWLSV